MNLVKWLRKNNTKVMAIVVIVIMFGFVGGSYLSYLGRKRANPRKTVAHFLNDRKITSDDLSMAHVELDILGRLRADDLLRAQDMQGLLLAELLFTEGSGRDALPGVIDHIKRTITSNRYRISNSQIADIYERSYHATFYWLLLKEEAHRAGIRVSRDDIGGLLAGAIPQLFNGITYAQKIGQLMNDGISEERVLSVFADLLAVLQYAHLSCSNENITARQIMHTIAQENQFISTAFVRVSSEVFAKTQDEPAEDKILEHFNKYKEFAPATVSGGNPYGFGYQLPDRVRLEYMILKLDEVSAIAKRPTHEETEGYYQRNREVFTEQVPSDPNDPNAPLVDRIMTYAEVVDIIREQLFRDRIYSKAESILQQAKTLTEPNLAGTNQELGQLTSEQFKEQAGDYESAAEKLSKEHNVKVYTGQTGLLSAIDTQTDEHLARLSIQGFGNYPVNLTQVVFAVDGLDAAELGPFDAPKPRLYETIGPAKDPYIAARGRLKEATEQIVAIARVTEAIPACEPNGIDETYSTHGVILDASQNPDPNDVYSTRKAVVENLKKLAAIETAKTKAGELIELAAQTDWDTAIDRFNELYSEQAEQEPNASSGDPNAFRFETFSALRRTPTMRLKMLAAQQKGNPAAKLFLNQAELERQFSDRLYSLVPPDSNTPDALPVVVEFEPAMSFFCIKSLLLKRLWREDFDRIKTMRLYQDDRAQVQSLAPVHFNPQNILKRLKFRVAEKFREPGDANTPTGTEAAT